MYRDSHPAWHRDVKWASGVLLVLSLAAATMFFSAAQITERARAEPLLQSVLELTLLPGNDDAAPPVAVRRGMAYEAGEPLQLLPGVDVFADPTEIADFTVAEAISRIAGVLADRTLRDGSEGARALVSAPVLGTQLQDAFDGPIPRMVHAIVANELLPAGLADGSRFANWPLQALQNPGEPVQPVVGIFVFVDPARLQGATSREIAELVVRRLVERVLGQGLAAGEEVVSNQTLRTLLVQTFEDDVREALHEFFSTLLVSHREESRSRLEQARTILEGTESAADQGLLGLIPAEDLAGLDQSEVNEEILGALATRAYEGGGEAVLSVLTESDQASRIAAVVPLIDALSARAHARYVRWTWFVGAPALLFLTLLIAFSKGAARLVNPGFAIALSAAAGALLFVRLASGLGSLGTVGLPLSVQSEGLFAYLFGLVAYVGANLPGDAIPLFVRNHLIVLGVGGGLLVLAALLRIVQWLRPRRRSLL